MKTASAFILILAMGFQAQAQESNLIGTWKLTASNQETVRDEELHCSDKIEISASRLAKTANDLELMYGRSGKSMTISDTGGLQYKEDLGENIMTTTSAVIKPSSVLQIVKVSFDLGAFTHLLTLGASQDKSTLTIHSSMKGNGLFRLFQSDEMKDNTFDCTYSRLK